MEVFITYDRYEHDEWFTVYFITTDIDEAYQHCREEDLFDFISYGPDDCHSFQLQRVVMTKKDYNKLRKLFNKEKLNNEEQKEFDKIMENIYHADGYETETLISTDGQSDYFNSINYHCGEEPDYDDYDTEEEYDKAYAEYENSVNELCGDDELFKKVLKEYIASNY